MNNSKTKDLTVGNLPKQIMLFSLPLMVTNVLQVLFNIADVAVVGRFAGDAALGAVSSAMIIAIFFGGMIMGFGGGINVVVAFHYGTKNNDNISRAVSTAFIMSAVLGISFFIAAELLCRPVLAIIGTRPELFSGAELYLRIIFCGLPAGAIYNFGNAVYSAAGDTRKPFIILTMCGITNVLLNLFFVIVCKMSVAGVALATIISQYLSAIIVLITLTMSKQPHKLHLFALKLDGKMVKSILSLGLPYSAQIGIFHLANMFFQYGVNSFDAAVVAGNGAAGNADAIVYNMMAAFYTACGSFMGQNFGAGNKIRIKHSYMWCLLFSAVVGQVGFLLFIIFGTQFMGLFSTDAAVIQAGIWRMKYLGMIYGITALMDCTIAGARALGHGIMPTVIVIMGSCVFRIIWIFTIFAHLHTVGSLFMLYPVSWTITAIAEVIYFVIIFRKEMKKIS
ncbi:MAG: MATE family efflux transporter [Spirochaetales bacterium]|nr:MATE family efflux transporter [Spirochaetales bacterium]